MPEHVDLREELLRGRFVVEEEAGLDGVLAFLNTMSPTRAQVLSALDSSPLTANVATALKSDLRRLKKYSPDQPRHPKGVSEGGQFASADGGATASAQAKPKAPVTKPDISRGVADVKRTSAFNRAAWEEKPVPDRKAEFERLPADERDRLANARVSIKAVTEERLAFAGARPTTGAPLDAANARLKAIGDFIAPDAAERISKNMGTISALLKEVGSDEAATRTLMVDMVDMLAVQENESIGRSLGDHGVRHVLGDAEMALAILAVEPFKEEAVAKASVFIAAVYHDTGYLTPPSQVFLDGDHPHWGGQHYRANVDAMVSEVVGKEWSDRIATMVDTHAYSDIDWETDPVTSALRAADNLALFQKEKLPGLLHYVPDNIGVLLKLASKEISVEEARKQAMANVDKQEGLSDPVREALRRSSQELSAITPKLTLGMLGGEVEGFEWNENHLEVNLRRNKTAFELQKVLDLGQKQFHKFAKTFGVDPKAFTDSPSTQFVKNGRVFITANILDEALKSLVRAHLR